MRCLNDRFEVPRVDVLLTDELTGDLRTMPVGKDSVL